MIYATELPTGLVKIGRASRMTRVTAAQIYFADPVRVLAVWEVRDDITAERAAHAACAMLHVSGELFAGGAALVAMISEVLGGPRAVDLPKSKPGRPLGPRE